ncbi:MAG: tRNA lysidine(34) synthetase TilS, partial [Acidimicrobiia bacterium]
LPPVAYPLSAWRAVFDADLVGPRAQLRAAGRRDQVTVLGGSKQVVDALAEAGVPAEERTSWPVVAVGEEVLWVPGVRRARSGWVTGDTLRYLFLSAEREPAWRPARS